MAETTRLKLPYLAAAQAQKHVTHNEALAWIDALVAATALDKDLATPPGSPADGTAYIVAAGATGAWSGWDDSLAQVLDGSYVRHLPCEGMQVWVADEAALYVYRSSAWHLLAYPDATAVVDVASAATCAIGGAGSRFVRITGTTGISSFGTAAAGTWREGYFEGALTLTHNGTSLILPKNGSNITTAAGDRFRALSLGSGNWIVLDYTRANGRPLDGTLATIASLSPSNDDLLQVKSGAWANRTPAQVLTDLLANDAAATGTLLHERGGLEADVSAYDGLVRITGGATSALAYVEATFTPTYGMTGVGLSSVTYDTQSARVTRIGRTVHWQIYLATDAVTVGGATGFVKIDGLPYTSISGGQLSGVGNCQSAGWGGNNALVWRIQPNAAWMYLAYLAALGGGSTAMTAADYGTGANANVTWCSGSYMTS